MKEELIFHQVLEQPVDQREAFLNVVCGADQGLRERVSVLLRAQANPGSFLQSPAVGVALTIDHSRECPGTNIGPYKLLEQIGEGGMGVVYVAEQTEPVRRRVALKIIKPGMDTRQVIARFEAERQALAMMDHPNIARVLDADTTEAGRPYFVMELVRGLPITEYCDKARLSPRQRLELFVDVCHAVQHAHQKGVIHRDLKPSNVMITVHDGRPMPKVIDFGVAKAVGQQLTDRTVYTAHTQLVGTPLYMSPEQADLSSQDVDTRSDVYSLGVLLYELLTGQTPFDKDTLHKAGFDEMRRIIREDDPPRPSHRVSTLNAEASSTISQQRGLDERNLSRALRGELDWIVMKSLEKDRTRRYESASAFAADIQRYLTGDQVLACPPTTMYRFQKFARKHQPALVTAASIALCLLLGTTVSAWQAIRATEAESEAKQATAAEAQQRQRAEANEQKVAAERDEVKALADKLAAKEQQLERTLYAAHMNLAHNAFEAGAPGRLRELLAQHRPQPGEPDLRGFEWHYLNRLSPTDLLVLKGHTGAVYLVAYSPDGKQIATSTGDGTVKLWDAQTGKELHSLNAGGRVPGNLPGNLAYSPDGKRIATGGDQSAVKIWNPQTGQELRTIKLSLRSQSRSVSSVAFSPDGKYLAAGAYSAEIKMLDAESFEELWTFEGVRTRGTPDPFVSIVAFSADGKRLASAWSDQSVKFFDVQTGDKLSTIEGVAGESVAFSPDGKLLASAAPRKALKLWDSQTGKELRTLQGHAPSPRCVTFSPDGMQLASGAGDGSVTVWDTGTWEELVSLGGHAALVVSVAFSPDGKHLASASLDKTVKVREAKAIPEARTIGRGVVADLAFSDGGKRLASVDQPFYTQIMEWDTQTGEQLSTIDTGNRPPGQGSRGSIQTGSFSADGTRAATAIDSGAGPQGIRTVQATIWDLQTGKQVIAIPFSYPNPNQIALVLSPDGRRLAAAKHIRGGSEQAYVGAEIKVWDAQTGQELRSIPSAGWPVVFTPDGQRLAGTASDKSVKIWELATGAEVRSFQGTAGCVAVSPDGKRLASSTEDAIEIKVWDVHTGDELLTLRGHRGIINRLAFSPDGKRLASTARDAALKIWDSQTGQELLTLAGNITASNGIAFTPDGHWLACGGQGTIRIYDATPLPEKP